MGWDIPFFLIFHFGYGFLVAGLDSEIFDNTTQHFDEDEDGLGRERARKNIRLEDRGVGKSPRYFLLYFSPHLATPHNIVVLCSVLEYSGIQVHRPNTKAIKIFVTYVPFLSVHVSCFSSSIVVLSSLDSAKSLDQAFWRKSLGFGFDQPGFLLLVDWVLIIVL